MVIHQILAVPFGVGLEFHLASIETKRENIRASRTKGI
jgi:hypothetical protein